MLSSLAALAFGFCGRARFCFVRRNLDRRDLLRSKLLSRRLDLVGIDLVRANRIWLNLIRMRSVWLNLDQRDFLRRILGIFNTTRLGFQRSHVVLVVFE